ncbi:ATP synthase-coupling factor 6, mitochondrial [Agrilus planipennis]|uniref:ATP synthase-coupling factor 6, mitochondrial n=1 Tax=Agrilus planipennis TaxID=224129 RepID=A0A1W4XIN9_AGRPL|nr:ATP synthase-coupling factor 6, mitochondrial [Agrilus planipennis]
MLSYQVLNNVKKHFRGVICQRNLGVFAPALQKATDPIQQLFLDKVREYKQKSDGGKKLVEPTPEIEKELKAELEKVAKQYGGGEGVDMTKFPTFTFKDPVIDPINMEEAK